MKKRHSQAKAVHFAGRLRPGLAAPTPALCHSQLRAPESKLSFEIEDVTCGRCLNIARVAIDAALQRRNGRQGNNGQPRHETSKTRP